MGSSYLFKEISLIAILVSAVHMTLSMINKKQKKASIDDCSQANQYYKDDSNLTSSSPSKKNISTKKKPVRIYIDGCFDMMHFGHANALRQASKCGDVLVVGLVNDEEVERNKGSTPLQPNAERLAVLKACKWVDEVIENVPYDLTPEFCEELFEKHNISFVVHGDDPCYSLDGADAYAYAKSKGKFRMIKRTEGISTTDIVGRMLKYAEVHTVSTSSNMSGINSCNTVAVSEFLLTSRRMNQFACNKAPEKGQKVVYISGGFDMFHAGHVTALEEAKKHGDFLIVGIHKDEDVKFLRGDDLPIMNLHERVLSVLACRYVDEVIMGAPIVITEDLMKSMNIQLVLHSTLDMDSMNEEQSARYRAGISKSYTVPKSMGSFISFSPSMSLTLKEIFKRVIENEEKLVKKFKKKSLGNDTYYKDKVFVEEL